MSTTTATETVEPRTEGPSTVRRPRRPWQLAIALVAVAGIAMSMTGCTPEANARAAIEPYWGSKTECAVRIVKRESNFDPAAVNPYSGTTGLFQIHPVHATWIKSRFGYEFSQMKDGKKNARVARALADDAHRMWGDGWAPWRTGGRAIPNGGCPA